MNRRQPPEDQVISTSKGDVVLSYSRSVGRKGVRLITACLADSGKEIGYLTWMATSGEISIVRVNYRMRLLGLATAMYEMGKTAPGRGPCHSPDRTRRGDAWARAVGGRLPRLWY